MISIEALISKTHYYDFAKIKAMIGKRYRELVGGASQCVDNRSTLGAIGDESKGMPFTADKRWQRR
ncbi:MAG: hypothetical protein LCH34_08915 [Firmicutes bacterium]|nr:hypothetical protein [Bacillota bacterium]